MAWQLELLDAITIDMRGKTCNYCHEGTYDERSLYDDWECMYTCDKCGDRTKSDYVMRINDGT